MKQRPSVDAIISAAAAMAAGTAVRGSSVDEVLAIYGEFIAGLTFAHGLETPAKFEAGEPSVASE